MNTWTNSETREAFRNMLEEWDGLEVMANSCHSFGEVAWCIRWNFHYVYYFYCRGKSNRLRKRLIQQALARVDWKQLAFGLLKMLAKREQYRETKGE
jgi:hypothetical protein